MSSVSDEGVLLGEMQTMDNNSGTDSNYRAITKDRPIDLATLNFEIADCAVIICQLMKDQSAHSCPYEKRICRLPLPYLQCLWTHDVFRPNISP